MAGRVQVAQNEQNRWLRPLIPILGIMLAGAALFFVGHLIASVMGPLLNGSPPTPFDPLKWVPYILVGGVIAYGLSVTFGDPALWRVGTREVVYMGIGAALYGILSWGTNYFALPSISLISLRPAVVIPIFFGITFGPAVGFFTGLVGNILGDALTGWGVYPIWSFGNGLMGMVPGLILAFKYRERSTDVVLGVVAAIALMATLLLLLFPETGAVFGAGTVGSFWWVPLLGLALIAGVRFLFRANRAVAAAQVWGALGIVVGIGFAAVADIWWNGYTFLTTFLGQFVPAAGSNLINTAILLPLLIASWNAAQSRFGR